MSLRIVMPITAAFVAFVTVARADVSVERKGSFTIYITIDRTITTQDAMIVSQLETELGRKQVEVRLDSEGGNLYAALKIGRVLRAVEATTNIVGKCYSGCALIFIAGVIRRLKDADRAELGLHRPYMVSSPQSREALEQLVPAMLDSLRKYVAEMGVGENFYQEMINTEPSEMKRYNFIGIPRLVPTKDPTHDEIMTSFMASVYGLTTGEYRKRQAEGLRLCAKMMDYVDFVDCPESVRWGLSQSVYRQRMAVADASCKMSEDDRRFLEAVSNKERQRHPSTVAFYSCRRSIMLGR